MTKIIYTNKGIASTIGKEKSAYIQMNKNLLKDKYLYDHILAHEKKHLLSNDLLDTKIELEDMKDYKFHWKLFLWQLKNPKSFSDLIPWQKLSDGSIAIDRFKIKVYKTMSLVYLLILFIFLIVWRVI